MKAKMKAKEYLQQVSKLDKMIKNKLIEKEQWKDIALGTTAHSDGERVQASSSQQKMADAVCKYIEIEKEIDSCIDNLVDIKQDVIHTIEQLPTKEYDVLHKIYIQGMTLDEVADLYDSSKSWVAKVHGFALKKVQEIIDEVNKSEQK